MENWVKSATVKPAKHLVVQSPLLEGADPENTERGGWRNCYQNAILSPFPPPPPQSSHLCSFVFIQWVLTAFYMIPSSHFHFDYFEFIDQASKLLWNRRSSNEYSISTKLQKTKIETRQQLIAICIRTTFTKCYRCRLLLIPISIPLHLRTYINELTNFETSVQCM